MEWFRKKLAGWKTRLVSLSMVLIGLIEAIDKNALVDVLGDGSRSYVTIGFGVMSFILYEVTKARRVKNA